MDRFSQPKKLEGMGHSVWTHVRNMIKENHPVNLGQGSPDYFAAPEHMLKHIQDIVGDDRDPLIHQYTACQGHPRLLKALADFYSNFCGRDIDWQTEVVVTIGAEEALLCAITVNVDPGDEVIIIEPFFDAYQTKVKLAGGIPVYVPLRVPEAVDGKKVVSTKDVTLDFDELRSKFGPKTKVIIINTPHNPFGKVFTQEELEVIADLCKTWNCLAICDEVYEHLVHPGSGLKHIRLATLTDMWERTITIGSAGKAFSVTGWRIGWAYGPKHLIQSLATLHTINVYSCPTPIQEAVARTLESEFPLLDTPQSYFTTLAREMEHKKKFTMNFLTKAGFTVVEPDGGYFIMADWTNTKHELAANHEQEDCRKDYQFVEWLSRAWKLQGIPPSALYSTQHKAFGEKFIRFCFIKKEETLQNAANTLKTWCNSTTTESASTKQTIIPQ